MSHEVENMFTVATPAWHRLGTVLENAPRLDEALVMAGLDWDVQTRPLFFPAEAAEGGGKFERKVVPGFKVNIRSTDQSVLGVVTDSYKTAQNAKNLEALSPAIDSGEITLETGGSLMAGRRCWFLARYADNMEVKPGDPVVPYLLVAWGHDGKMGVRIMNTPTRVVCANTLHAAGAKTGDIGESFKDSNNITIAHTGNVDAKVAAAIQAVQVARVEFAQTIDIYRAMAGRPVDVQTVKDFAREMFDADYVKAKQLVAKLQRRALTEEVVQKAEFAKQISDLEVLIADRESSTSYTERAIVESFETGPGADIAGSTAWGLFNAATDYIDHTRSNGDEAGLKSSWFGSGAGLRKKSFEAAVGLLG